MQLLDNVLKNMLRRVEGLAPIHRLLNALPHLGEAEQAIVRFLMLYPREASDMSSTQLTAAAGASPATLFRLCRRLEFSGYAELRQELLKAVSQYGANFIRPHEAIRLRNESLNVIHTGVYGGISYLLDTTVLDEAELQAAAVSVYRAARLHLCGLGPVSARLAEMASFTFQRIGAACVLWTDIQTLTKAKSRLNSHDALLALSHSGENEAIAQFVYEARDAGAATIALVNYGQSAVAKAAAIRLVTNLREATVQNYDLLPRISQLVVLQMLANFVHELQSGDKHLDRRGE